MKKKLIIIGAVIVVIIIIVIAILQFTKRENKVTITFDTNGGQHESALEINKGTTTHLPEVEREGYTFIGWYTEDGKEIDSKTVITSNIKLVAKWQKNETRYQVTFDANGGAHTTMDGGNNVLVQFTENNGIVLKPVDPERTGYNFIGWYTEDGKVFDFKTVIASNIKLVAKWQRKETRYQVTFDANGGAHTTMDGGNNVLVQFTENNGTVLKPVDPERAGYNFIGWYTEDGKVFNFNTVITSNIKLVAKWQRK